MPKTLLNFKDHNFGSIDGISTPSEGSVLPQGNNEQTNFKSHFPKSTKQADAPINLNFRPASASSLHISAVSSEVGKVNSGKQEPQSAKVEDSVNGGKFDSIITTPVKDDGET